METISFIKNTLNVEKCFLTKRIQSLWAGYGNIDQYCIKEKRKQYHVILKEIVPPKNDESVSFQRKMKSYEVEISFYLKYSHLLFNFCKIPQILGSYKNGDKIYILLQDVKELSFDISTFSPNNKQIRLCLRWLAYFHATFMGIDETETNENGLWNIGSYWHLDTRMEEYNRMSNGKLKKNAFIYDQQLKDAQYQTLIHGDAKMANFLFSCDDVIGYDFQYVGRSCGMRDVAYLIGDFSSKRENCFIDDYFQYLKEALENLNSKFDFNAVETEWRALYPIAKLDFQRFLEGW
eukprot:TRINITY_DN7934_c0_g1_i1.p1 TRINITY_DN7934_c0_g1~~TRINITY_DN7934_c0_g1_i1.p1  ORF type:complete len:292 (+),score=82.98 TRINITY_DN7934_c0_g1_i1:27-902(+)